MWPCTLLSHLIGIACLEGGKLLAFIASNEVFFQILPQAKRRVEILPNQSRQWKKKQQCKPLKRVYKAVGCMSEHSISQDSIKSEQHSSRALAKHWTTIVFMLHILLFIIPITACFGGSCCIWTVTKTAFSFVQRKLLRSSSQTTGCNNKVWSSKHWKTLNAGCRWGFSDAALSQKKPLLFLFL